VAEGLEIFVAEQVRDVVFTAGEIIVHA
jgi:hypothetical protein